MTLVDSAPRPTTLDRRETAKFASLAEEWWRPDGKFAPLHRMNPARLEFIREEIYRHFSLAPADQRRPFKGLRIIDLGCGGGLVTEPMARLGAQVLGVDAAPEAIAVARAHARGAAASVDYRVALPEDLPAQGEAPADVVLALEIVEHVADLQSFAVAAANMVKPGGLLILSTINRTPEAFAFALVGAERLLRWLPPGTHEFEKLVTPDELRAAFDGLLGLAVRGPVGLSYNPFTGRWKLGLDSRVNYLMTAAKAD